LLEKKYLKTIYNCHLCAGTLDGGDIDGDGELTVLDICGLCGEIFTFAFLLFTSLGVLVSWWPKKSR
jgi:hypothetical protein